MKITGLDGRVYNWSPTGRGRGNERPSSRPHQRARRLLARLFPLERRLEEVHLPGGFGALYADFYLPALGLVVEVQGPQHDDFIPHFHGDITGYWRSQSRDDRKRQWCERNNLRLIELPHDEDDAAWQTRLLG
jgi:hypothetical protein